MIKAIINQTIKTDKCRCGDMFAHWKKFGHQDIRSCPVKECHGVDVTGKFVTKAESPDTQTYIIPLCSEHAKSTEVLEVLDVLAFVNSDFSNTCGTAPAEAEEARML